MQSEPKDWGTVFGPHLDVLDGLYRALHGRARELRDALVRRDIDQARGGLEDLRDLTQKLHAAEREAASALQAGGLLGPDARLRLDHLVDQEPVRRSPALARHLDGVIATARRAAREIALGRRVMERLALWNQREVRFLLGAISGGTNYGAGGRRQPSTAQPALVDRRT